MTPNQEELRESFLQEFFEPTFVDLRPYDISFREEKMIDWWLSKLNQASRLERAIESLGDDFFQLTKGSDIWYAEGDIVGTEKVTGATPLEALENLQSKLHEK